MNRYVELERIRKEPAVNYSKFGLLQSHKHMKDSRCVGWYPTMHKILSVPKLLSKFNITLGLK
jgi:hypothetical protein